MNWKSAAWLLLIPLLGSCADGGSRGSGISMAQGNVDSVQMATAPRRRPSAAETLLTRVLHLISVEKAAARNQLEGIHVTVEATGVTSDTDANGFFSLRGLFEGEQTLLFERSEDGITARLTINIPAGGALTLSNVSIDQPSGRATAQSQAVDFEGLITAADCPDRRLTLVSSQRNPAETDTYTVDLTTSAILDRRGNAVACDQLVPGEKLRVQGTVNDDGTFGGATIRTED